MKRRLTILVAAASLAWACAPARPPAHPEPARAETVEMEPIKVVATPEGEGFAFETYDAADLFDKGNDLLEEGRCEDALRHYDRLLKEFSASGYASAARYNSALCLERLGRFQEAVDRYRVIWVDYPGSPDAKDALFRAGGCEEQMRAWEDARHLFSVLLDRTDLDATEQVEAMARRGAALVELDRLEEGERQLREAIAFYRVRSASTLIATDYHAAMAQFYLGEAARRRMAGVTLTDDEAAFQRDLDLKARLLLKAQTAYVLAIRTMNPYWAAASGLRIGRLFAALYDDILDVPAPAWIAADPELLAIHMKARHRLIRNLVVKAIRVWEETVLMAERVGIHNAWIDEANQQLARVKARLKEADEEDTLETLPDRIAPAEPADAGPAPDLSPVG